MGKKRGKKNAPQKNMQVAAPVWSARPNQNNPAMPANRFSQPSLPFYAVPQPAPRPSRFENRPPVQWMQPAGAAVVQWPRQPSAPGIQATVVTPASQKQEAPLNVNMDALAFLDLESKAVYSKPFSELTLEERAKLWHISKDQRSFGFNQLSDILLILDCSFRSDDNPMIHFYSYTKLKQVASNVFHMQYALLNFGERDLLRKFMVAIKGNYINIESKKLNEIGAVYISQALKHKFQRVEHAMQGKKNGSLENQLVNITQSVDADRFKYLLEQQARNDYDISYDRLCIEVQQYVQTKVYIDYKMQILRENGKVPIILDESAYLLYETPFKQLSTFAQYFAKRFQELLILKQWAHLRVSKANIVRPFQEDPFAMAYYAIQEKDLKFLFNEQVNNTMLTSREQQGISNFPNNFPKRFAKVISQVRTHGLEYLAALFGNNDEIHAEMPNAQGFAMNPQPLVIPSHIQQAFMTEQSPSRSADETISQASERKFEKTFKPVEEESNAEPQAAKVAPPKPLASSSTSYANYMDVMESLDEAQAEVKALEELDSQPQQRCKEKVLFKPDKGGTLVNFSAGSIANRLNMYRNLKNKFGEFIWTKFKLLNTSQFSKETILFAFIEELRSHHSNPRFPICSFCYEGTDSVFYSSSCAIQIEALLRKNLTLNSSELGQVEVILEVDCEKPENTMILGRVHSAVKNALDVERSHLDLSEFHKNSELEPYIFFPLAWLSNQMTVMSYVPNITKSLKSLDMSNNRLTRFDVCNYESLAVPLRNLQVLDLRNNLLNMSALYALSHLPLKQVYLDGNPLCSFYSTEKEYIEDILKLWPQLEVLDGLKIVCAGTLGLKPNYFLHKGSEEFVQQFLTHYFSIFDSDRRDLLSGIYHSKALMSLTCTVQEGQSTTDNANLSFYLQQSRNLKTMSDMTKSEKLLKEGNKAIMDFYQLFSPTEHAMSSFCVDVTSYTEKSVHMTVSGVFREKDSSVPPRFFTKKLFIANFNGSYLIVNELLYITNCTTEQANVPFEEKDNSLPVYDLYLSSIPKITVFNDEQKLGLMKKLSDVTGMNVRWSKKCLDDMKWDLRNALIYFQQFYNMNLIPSDAFL